jgi:hypothetical protein
LRNFNQLTPAAKPTNKKWVGGIAALSALSIAGGFGVNAILNPATNTAGISGDVTAPQTVTGDLIDYRYGAVQLEVTETDGKIDSIKEIQATASSAYEAVFPLLNEAAIAAQSTDFANVSGATYSSEAYKEALVSSLSKLK